MEDILREIDAALERLGLSARAASIRAQGAPEMIRDMRRGHVPSVERLRSLCEVLDLEFYVGQRRMPWDEREGAPSNLMYTLEQLVQDLAQLMADAGGDPVSDDLWPVLAAKRAAGSPQFESEFTEVGAAMLNKALSAAAERCWREGSRYGVTTIDAPESRRVKPLLEVPIARGWPDSLFIHLHGLDPANCEWVEIRDEYMEPTLPNGCTVLVDHESTDWRPSCIMAVRIDDDVIARRAAVDDDGRPLLASNHPDWPVAPLSASAQVVGEVRWAGFWLDRTSFAGERVGGIPASTLAPQLRL